MQFQSGLSSLEATASSCSGKQKVASTFQGQAGLQEMEQRKHVTICEAVDKIGVRVSGFTT
jgi:hypothetical protein